MKTALDRIKQAETTIESAIWDDLREEDSRRALKVYEKAKAMLESLKNLDVDTEKQRKRVLSFCLLRIDDVLVTLGDEAGSMARAREVLELALQSEDEVQIARAQLLLGTRLLNAEDITGAEEQFAQILTRWLDSDNSDLQQVVGWTLLVRGHILNAKSLYSQAIVVLQHAESILTAIGNYAGLAKAYDLMSEVYLNLGDSDMSDECRTKSSEYLEKAKVEKR
jgi:tetratricopeptide (TPR) repeat protein